MLGNPLLESYGNVDLIFLFDFFYSLLICADVSMTVFVKIAVFNGHGTMNN